MSNLTIMPGTGVSETLGFAALLRTNMPEDNDDAESFGTLPDGSSNGHSIPDGLIYANIRWCQLNNPQGERSWWPKLTNSKGAILRRVEMHGERLSPAETSSHVQDREMEAGPRTSEGLGARKHRNRTKRRSSIRSDRTPKHLAEQMRKDWGYPTGRMNKKELRLLRAFHKYIRDG